MRARSAPEANFLTMATCLKGDRRRPHGAGPTQSSTVTRVSLRCRRACSEGIFRGFSGSFDVQMDLAELVAIPLFAAFALNDAFNDVSDNWKIFSGQMVPRCFEAPGVIVDLVSVCELFLEPRIGAPRVGNLRAFSLICAGLLVCGVAI
jgi:hypothetical protein